MSSRVGDRHNDAVVQNYTVSSPADVEHVLRGRQIQVNVIIIHPGGGSYNLPLHVFGERVEASPEHLEAPPPLKMTLPPPAYASPRALSPTTVSGETVKLLRTTQVAVAFLLLVPICYMFV